MRIHPALIGTRVAVIGVLAAFAAGCADTHIGSDPFYTPFGSRDKDTTGSVAAPRAAPTGQVSTRPLPPPYYPPASVPAANGETRVPTHATLPPPPEHTRWPRSAAPSSGYEPPATVAARPAPSMARTPPTVVPPRAETTGAVPVGAGAADQWSWNGGKAIVVQPGETLALLARRHAVPVAAIMRANNLSHPAVIRPGQRLVIPAYTYRPGSTAADRSPQTPVATAHGATTSHVVNSGETLHALARRYKTTPAALASANGLAPNARLTVGQKLIVPGGPLASAAAPQPTRPAEPAPRRAETRRPDPANDADGPTSSVAAGKPAKPDGDSADVGELRPGMAFRWPVRGRVIATFGAKPGGERNDGINIAVPEGASIKAAEDGTVAYAGSELKGYGNLVLLRHANGWVTAYAHNSEILVRRGDAVKRGQIISRSGQTGSVNSPQLHFEIRRGSNPVDPMPMLTGG